MQPCRDNIKTRGYKINNADLVLVGMSFTSSDGSNEQLVEFKLTLAVVFNCLLAEFTMQIFFCCFESYPRYP
jgi:hypothetical protein